MAFYRNHIYPYLVAKLGDPPPIKRVREQIIPLARGNVLEIGSGSGANFPHYGLTKVSKFYALEPNPGMIRLAKRQQHRAKLNVEYIHLQGESIPPEVDSVDTVVSTFTLCTIPDITAALRGIVRVLKPDGKLIFFELGLALDLKVRQRQRQLEPIYQRLFQGLYLTRDIPLLIMDGGFEIKRMEKGYLAQFPKASSYCWWGFAVPRFKEPE